MPAAPAVRPATAPHPGDRAQGLDDEEQTGDGGDADPVHLVQIDRGERQDGELREVQQEGAERDPPDLPAAQRADGGVLVPGGGQRRLVQPADDDDGGDQREGGQEAVDTPEADAHGEGGQRERADGTAEGDGRHPQADGEAVVAGREPAEDRPAGGAVDTAAEGAGQQQDGGQQPGGRGVAAGGHEEGGGRREARGGAGQPGDQHHPLAEAVGEQPPDDLGDGRSAGQRGEDEAELAGGVVVVALQDRAGHGDALEGRAEGRLRDDADTEDPPLVAGRVGPARPADGEGVAAGATGDVVSC